MLEKLVIFSFVAFIATLQKKIAEVNSNVVIFTTFFNIFHVFLEKAKDYCIFYKIA
jgi:hypothetical protein